MNRIFTHIFKVQKSIAKYLVFSIFFVFAFFVGFKNEVGAANTDFPYSNSDAIVPATNASACSASFSNGNLSYVLKSSNYGGNATGCVAYTFPGTGITNKLFYLQGEDTHILPRPISTSNLQTIQFTINASDVGDFTDIAIYEKSYTLGSTVSYDLYSLKNDGSGDFDYKHILPVGDSRGWDQSTFYASNGIEKGNFTDGSTLTFSYAMRNPQYGLNSIFINFYNSVTDITDINGVNFTKNTQIDFYFAKPVSDFNSEVVEENTSCNLNPDATGKICVVYKNDGSTTGRKNINVYFPKNVAFYFSTTYNHTSQLAAAKPVEAEILKYNSIYAYNNHNNVDGSAYEYLFYNLTDSSSYDSNVNSKINLTGDNYAMYLTIDARGTYVFTITDIFNKNQSTEELEVTDVENRDLDIYFLKAMNSAGDDDVSKENSGDDLAEFFEVTAASDLTIKNINIVLEFFYTIQINSDLAVGTGGSIKANPLTTEDDGRLVMASSNYCKLYVSGTNDASRTYECLAIDLTNFKNHALSGTQTIPATHSQLNTMKSVAVTDESTCASGTADYEYGCIKNEFALVQGTVNSTKHQAKFVTGKANKTNIWVNENGSYKVYIKDRFGNETSSWIDVSVIDQYQPTIAFGPDITGHADITDNNISSVSFSSTGSTTLCTSTYAYGGNSNYAAKIYGETGYNANCTEQSVTYDVTGDGTLETSIKGATTGRKDDADPNWGRFLLNTQGTNALKLVYYNTNGLRSFNYADAIRIARLTAVDSITSLSSKNATSKTITVKSRYQVNSSATYESYALSTRSTQSNWDVIGGNYLQYASELMIFNTSSIGHNIPSVITADQLQIRIEVEGSYIDFGTNDFICNSTANAENCYKYVNSYIDRNVDFKIVFNAVDYVGNISDDYTITVSVIDDTSAGIIDINNETGAINDATPDIHMINIDTICRLEVGNNIQAKNDLLGCYGLATLAANGSVEKYTFADNESGYKDDNTRIKYGTTNFDNVLSYQWYRYIETTNKAYDANIKVEINIGTKDSPNWKVVGTTQSANQQMKDAGYYQLKFTITDNLLSTGTSSDDHNNTTVLIVWYYVNPKVLLVAPQAQTVEYGTAASALQYKIYVSGNDEAFHTNIFELEGEDLTSFLDNYAEATITNNDFLILDNRELAGELMLIDKGTHDADSGKDSYTNNATYHKTINVKETVNAGAYYITLGNIRVINTADSNQMDSANYIIRLHPAYVINGTIVEPELESYDSDNVKENVSNVLFIVQQRRLNIHANGGSKVYGVLDTNYTYYDTVDAVTNTNTTHNVGYLNGYTIDSGLINTNYVHNSVTYTQTDTTSTTYNNMYNMFQFYTSLPFFPL